MKTTVNIHQFRDAFSIRPNSFTYEGQGALFEYLEQMEEDTGQEMELDPIALCCEFTEYENIREYNAEYDTGHEEYQDIRETTVISVTSESFIIQDY